MEAFNVQKVLEKLKSVCVPGFFSLSMHKNLGVRLYDIKRRKIAQNAIVTLGLPNKTSNNNR